MTKSEFEKLVQEGIDQIPEKFRKKLDNVVIIVEEEPNETQLQKLNLSKNALLFGLYQGIPQIRRGLGYSAVSPDKITIFQKSIEAIARSETEIRQMVKNTVWHEIAHHFGTSEKRVREIELKRRNNL